MDMDRNTSVSRTPVQSTGVSRTYLMPPPYGHSAEPGLDPSQIRPFLKRRFWSILLGFVSVMASVTLVTFLLPKSYESSASFLVEQDRNPVTAIPALDVLERMGQIASRETEVALIQSRRVVEPVVDRGDVHVEVKLGRSSLRPLQAFTSFEAGPDAIAGVYQVRPGPDGGLQVFDTETDTAIAKAAPGQPISFANVRAGALVPELAEAASPGVSGDRLEVVIIPFAEAVSKTQKRIKVASVQRDADLVAMTCADKTAEGAQWLCSAIAQSYLDLRSNLQTAEATATADFLSLQTELVQQRLTSAEDSLRIFAQQNSAVALETRASEEVRQNAGLWAEREQLIAERASLEALTRQIEANEGSGTRKYRDFASFPTFLKNQNQVVTQLVSSLMELDNRRNDLAVRRTDEDVELASLDARIVDIEGQLRDIAVGYTQALTAQINSLNDALANSEVLLASIPFQQIETARLERNLSLNEDLYGFLQTRLQEAKIAQAVNLPSVRVVDDASLPFEHSSPNEPLNLALGFLLATGFGLTTGFWREYTDPRVRGRETVEEETGTQVLGMLPAMKRPGPVISMKLVTSDQTESVALVPPWTPERALVLEAFRTLSFDLGFVGRDPGTAMRIVAVTSSTRGEGKTFVATNLAIARASHGAKTLLIDADLKGRGVTRFLRVPENRPGLTELLTSGSEIGGHVQTYEMGSGSPLYVMPAGAGTSHSAELLESERFSELLENVKRQYDLVVVDTPPLNVMADAAAVTSKVDGVVVVARGGLTDRAALEFTLERLRRIGAHTAGIVLNAAELPSSYKAYSHVG